MRNAIVRTWRFLVRYSVLSDWLDVGMLVVACVLAVNTISISTWVAILCGVIYLTMLSIRVVWQLRQRYAKDRLKGDVLWGVFDMLNNAYFNGDPLLRITLFQLDPWDSDFIIPWYRYEKAAGHNSVNAASRSTARYRRGQSLTGMAWATASTNIFQMELFPSFPTRADFEHYYTTALGVDASTVRNISDYMVGVGVLLSCGITDTRGAFLGVISIDCRWTCASTNPLQLIGSDGKPRDIRADGLLVLAILSHNILRSFAVSEGRA